MKRRPPRRAQPTFGAFTLLEVMVAVTLLGLLSVGLFDMVRVGVLGWRHVDERGAEAEDAAAVQDVLRRMIDSARPAVATGNGGTGLAFRGDAHSLDMIGELPDAIAPGLQGRERLFVARHGRSAALMLGWRLDLPGPGGGPSRETLVPLIENVAAVRFAYFGPPDDGGAAGWNDSWSGRTVLPGLVRIRVTYAADAGPRRPLPDFVAAPRATALIACHFDCLEN